MATFTALYDACVLYPAPLRELAKFCFDPHTSRLAAAYLTDLGRRDAIPDAAAQDQESP